MNLIRGLLGGVNRIGTQTSQQSYVNAGLLPLLSSHLAFLAETSSTHVKNCNLPGSLPYHLLECPVMLQTLGSVYQHGFSDIGTYFGNSLLFLWLIIANILFLLQAVCKSQIICTILDSYRTSIQHSTSSSFLYFFFPQRQYKEYSIVY